MTIQTVVIDSNSSGGGSGNAGPFFGELKVIKVTYGGTPDAGTDLTVTETGGLQRDVFKLTNNGTNVTRYPRAQISDLAGALVDGFYEAIMLDGPLTLTVAQAVHSQAAAVTVTIQVEP